MLSCIQNPPSLLPKTSDSTTAEQEALPVLGRGTRVTSLHEQSSPARNPATEVVHRSRCAALPLPTDSSGSCTTVSGANDRAIDTSSMAKLCILRRVTRLRRCVTSVIVYLQRNPLSDQRDARRRKTYSFDWLYMLHVWRISADREGDGRVTHAGA